MKKERINLGGRPVEAERMEVKATEEHWSTYRLEDGNIIKLKLVVSDVWKLPTPDPVTGLPTFIVKSSNIMSVEPPEPSLSKREVQ